MGFERRGQGGRRGRELTPSPSTKFLANPDLPARIAAGAALNDPKADLLHVGDLTYTGPEGHTDYPPLTPNCPTPYLQKIYP